MAWQEIGADTSRMALLNSRVLGWNTRLQHIMGDPTWVQLMWDPSERWLGVRLLNVPHGFRVNKDEAIGEYKIDSVDALDAAGISGPVNGEPEKWIDLSTGIPTDPDFGRQPIYYLTVPE